MVAGGAKIKPPTDPKPTYVEAVTLPDGSVEEVTVDGVLGPLVWQPDGSGCALNWLENHGDMPEISENKYGVGKKPWKEMGMTEHRIFIELVAKKNKCLRDLYGVQLEQKAQKALQEEKAAMITNAAPVAMVDTFTASQQEWSNLLKTLYGK
mmetsp:Transcript_52455/g.121985  ORF Transcript_52455/g.121985 Transcript_52455/m.121985 type:complete len:152 (+) Transcript_52455:67-522(+)